MALFIATPGCSLFGALLLVLYFTENIGPEPNKPNITTKHTYEELKWKRYVDRNTPIPTKSKTKGIVGCFEGAGTYETGLYRPQYDCVMKQQSLEVNGCFCRVCTYHASRIAARSMGLFIPVPGIMSYSAITRQWGQPEFATRMKTEYGCNEDYPVFNEVLSELRGQNVGVKIRTLFGIHPLPNKVKVFESQCFSAAYGICGLWYIISTDGIDMYYVRCFGDEHKNEVSYGKLIVPTCPVATIYDAAKVGLETHVFCADDGILSYGIQDAHGDIEGNFVAQTVTGLSTTRGICALSVEYKNPYIIVAVVDQGKTKIALYELLTRSWNASGFISMPTNEEIEFQQVKIAQLGSLIYVISNSDGTMYSSVFDTTNLKWDNVLSTFTEDATCFDICASDTKTYLISYDGAILNLYECNKNSGTWSSSIDITKFLGLDQYSIISSLNVAYLKQCIYITAIVGSRAVYASYDTVNKSCVTPFRELLPELYIPGNVGGMSLHSANNQLHLILSSMRKAFSENGETSRF